jgi:hypothetical protein
VRQILGEAKTVRELLKGVRYSIDDYQREYRWQTEQIRDLVQDLTGQFLESYRAEHTLKKVADYSHYFLGSIIVSEKDGGNYIVDGQQRLTSLTLLLILLKNQQEAADKRVDVDELIASDHYGEKTFNLDVDERNACMTALFAGHPYDTTDRSESVQNLWARYQDLEAQFDLPREALPYFVYWLIDNVHLVKISAQSDDDAYTIFETMNDRGLSLSPVDMLKGYLLANMEESQRSPANRLWRNRIQELGEVGKEVPSDFFKAWLRSQHATKIRERKKDAHPEDFDRMGTEFHRWVREASESIGLRRASDFFRFVDQDFDFYSRQYLRVLDASARRVEGLEHVLYNAKQGFTLQNMLLLSPLRPNDPEDIVLKKLRLVAMYVDILVSWRLWNFRLIAYSHMQYAMFLVMRDIRGLTPDALARRLHDGLKKESETFSSNGRLRVHQQNRYAIHRVLARITDYVETQSGQPSRYEEFMSGGKYRYEVEHIWADHAERHIDEFPHPSDFAEDRDRIGGLLLLPKSFNASYGDMPYTEKHDHYNAQNLLARSLHPLCYEHNPGFLSWVQRTGLPFRAHPEFKKTDLEERSELYRQIAERIWDPAALLREVGQ